MSERFTLRPPEAGDLPEMANTVFEGFDGYRAFGPPGWSPPARDQTLEAIRSRYESEGTWSLVALEGDAVAGHVTVIPSVLARQPGGERALALLWQLFVRPPYWGTGLAARLNGLAVGAAADSYEEIRLYTPVGQARARRFYEREGWTDAGRFDDPEFGMELVEYRRRLR